MAGILTLNPKSTTIPTVYDEYLYTLGRLQENPETQSVAPEFTALLPDINAARELEISLIAAQYRASAAVEFADDKLDGRLDGVANTLLELTGRNRNDPLYLRYFGSNRPSDLKRPVLGSQLETMKGWVESLQGSSNERLQAHGTALAAEVARAEAAADMQARASQQLTDFRSVVGMRGQLVEKLNALRKSIHGELSDIQHNTQGLGTRWAESFFRSSSSDERMTLAELDRRIADAELTLQALRKERAELEAREEEAARSRAEAERLEKEAQLAALRKAADELVARMTDLETELQAKKN